MKTATRPPFTYASVPALPNLDRVICLAGGPSLTQADVDACRGKGLVIAIKDAIRLAPWADVLYGCDAKWWRHYHDTLADFAGLRFALEKDAAPWAGVLKNTGMQGFDDHPTSIRTGQNSGYQAIHIAAHLGARRIVLLGYDMRPSADRRHHWFGPHPYPTLVPPYDLFLRLFDSIVDPLQKRGVQVVNATPNSKLRCFPHQSLTEALA